MRWFSWTALLVATTSLPVCPAQGTAGTIPVAESLVLSKETNNGSSWSWTLATRLSELLQEAEDRFRPRDQSYTLLGFEFWNRGYPQVWYPGNRKHVVIRLSRQASVDEKEAVFELSQECIHLLSPIVAGSVSVLEEGLGMVLAKWYLSKSFPQDPGAFSRLANANPNPNYRQAQVLLEQLLSIRP